MAVGMEDGIVVMLVQHCKQNRHARIERANQSAQETPFHAGNMFSIPAAVKSPKFTSQRVETAIRLLHQMKMRD